MRIPRSLVNSRGNLQRGKEWRFRKMGNRGNLVLRTGMWEQKHKGWKYVGTRLPWCPVVENQWVPSLVGKPDPTYRRAAKPSSTSWRAGAAQLEPTGHNQSPRAARKDPTRCNQDPTQPWEEINVTKENALTCPTEHSHPIWEDCPTRTPNVAIVPLGC